MVAKKKQKKNGNTVLCRPPLELYEYNIIPVGHVRNEPNSPRILLGPSSEGALLVAVLTMEHPALVQLGALIWQHAVLKRRAPRTTCCELLSPAIFLAVLVLGYAFSDIEVKPIPP